MLARNFLFLALILIFGISYSLATEPESQIKSMDIGETQAKPEDAEMNFKLGLDYFNKGQYDQAIPYFNEALKMNPGHIKAYYYRGFAYSIRREDDKAISDYSKALEIDPRFASAYYEKAFLCEITGKRKEAIKAYEGFIKCARPDDNYRIKDARGRIWKLKWGCFILPLILLIAGALCLWYSYHKWKTRSKNEKNNLDKRNRAQV